MDGQLNKTKSILEGERLYFMNRLDELLEFCLHELSDTTPISEVNQRAQYADNVFQNLNRIELDLIKYFALEFTSGNYHSDYFLVY